MTCRTWADCVPTLGGRRHFRPWACFQVEAEGPCWALFVSMTMNNSFLFSFLCFVSLLKEPQDLKTVLDKQADALISGAHESSLSPSDTQSLESILALKSLLCVSRTSAHTTKAPSAGASAVCAHLRGG